MATSVGSKPIVVWRTMRGRVVALDDSCPHQGNALSAGAVVGESLRCPVHGWEVASDGWCDRAGGATRRHPTRVADGEMYIRPRASSVHDQGGEQ